jgi:hypothetical protein
VHLPPFTGLITDTCCVEVWTLLFPPTHTYHSLPHPNFRFYVAMGYNMIMW